MKDLLTLVDKVKFKLEYIYIVGFDSFGHRIKACVCYIPTQAVDNKVIERYAFVKADDKLICLEETFMEGKFEITYSPPLLMWYAFKEHYVNKLENLEKVYADHILGKSIKELRKNYTYNPFLDSENKKPHWYTLAHMDEEYYETGVQFPKDELLPEEKPILKKVFAESLKKVKKKKLVSMKELYERTISDKMLIIEAVDKVNKKYNS